MDLELDHNDEQQAVAAFSSQSHHFDELYASNTIIQYKRGRVRDQLLKFLKPASNILELNAGTGEDAIFLAQRGHSVHATDIAAGMQKKLAEKVALHQVDKQVSQEICSFNNLDQLNNKGPFDAIFSNFAGLNCTGNLERVLHSFDGLLKPGGILALVILPGFCFWESLFILKGKFRTASRRFFSSSGRKANIDGYSFTCWYYSPGFIKKVLKENYTFLELEGLCTLVPPSYVENFPEKYPGLYSFLCKAENRLKNKWPWKNIGDYYIISFRKKGTIP